MGDRGLRLQVYLARAGRGSRRAMEVDGDRIRIAKVPSVPDHPDQGAMAALAAADIALGGVDDLVHGSTVATNAILERKGAPTAFLVTKGFRDLLFLQRHNRPPDWPHPPR